MVEKAQLDQHKQLENVKLNVFNLPVSSVTATDRTTQSSFDAFKFKKSSQNFHSSQLHSLLLNIAARFKIKKKKKSKLTQPGKDRPYCDV